MAQYEKLINLSLLNQFLTKAKTIFSPKINASGILKGDGTGNVSAATAGMDYATPALVKVSDTQPTESENKLWVDTDGSGNSYQVPTVAEMQAADNSILGNLAMIESSPATQAHAVGEYIVYNGQLYKVTAAIAQGESLANGTNVESTTVGNSIKEIYPIIGTAVRNENVTRTGTCKYAIIKNVVIVQIEELEVKTSGNDLQIFSGLPNGTAIFNIASETDTVMRLIVNRGNIKTYYTNYNTQQYEAYSGTFFYILAT